MFLSEKDLVGKLFRNWCHCVISCENWCPYYMQPWAKCRECFNYSRTDHDHKHKLSRTQEIMQFNMYNIGEIFQLLM